MKKMMLKIFLGFGLLSFAACGVKGPPLPPVADNPAASERENREVVAAPSPTPTPSPTPVKRTSKKSKKTSQ